MAGKVLENGQDKKVYISSKIIYKYKFILSHRKVLWNGQQCNI